MEEKQEQKQKKRYTPRQVSEILRVDNDLIRKWTEHFNIQVEWTKPDNSGHRRYTVENINELQAVKEKIQIEGWSWEEVRSWRNGEIDQFTTHEEKSNLEKKMDMMLEEMKMLQEKYEQQRQFNELLVDRLDNMNKKFSEDVVYKIESSIETREETKEEELKALKEKDEQQRQFNEQIVDKLDNINENFSQDILRKIESSIKEREEKKKSFWDIFKFKK